MLTEIFKSVLLMSAVGGVLSIFLLCVKPVTRKLFSPKWQYYIWLTVLIVMILPVRFSLPKQMPHTPDITTERVQNVQSEIEIPADNQNTITEIPKQSERFSMPKINLPQNIFYYLSCIWILGAIFIFFAKIIQYRLFLREIHKNSSADTSLSGVPKRLKVCRTDMLDAPLIVGLIKPVLYLPDTELSEDNLNYILMHELTHYKRHDLLYKWAVLTVKSIHWFNPFIYLVSKQIDLDCEVSCDFAVTTNLAQDEQNNYMNMILGLLANSDSQLRPLTTQMASSKKTLKRRFKMIRNKKKTSKFVSVLSAVLAVVMLGTTVFASGVLSGLTNENGHFYINGNDYGITPVFIENTLSVKTDSWYVPLRETFEVLGYEVIYDVDKGRYAKETGEQTFPIFDRDDDIFTDSETGEVIRISNKEYNDWLKGMVKSESDYYIYGATGRLNRQMPIIEMRKNGIVEYCQIGSRDTSMGYLFAAPTLIEGKAYIPIRAIAYLVGGQDNVKWSDEKHDTYYEGVLNFDADNLTITVNTGYTSTVFDNLEFMEGNISKCLKSADFNEPYDYKLIKQRTNYMNGGTEASFRYSIVSKVDGKEYYLEMTFACNQSDKKWYVYDSSFGDGQIFTTASEGLNNPQDTVKAFFSAFSQREFNVMSSYCTQKCVDRFFGYGYCFGMAKAELTDINIDWRENLKSSNDYNIFVTVNMTPHEQSVFDPSQTETSFYVILQRQPDGRYLIDEFATGL